MEDLSVNKSKKTLPKISKNLKYIDLIFGIYILTYVIGSKILTKYDLILTKPFYTLFLISLGGFLILFPLKKEIIYYSANNDESTKKGIMRTVKILSVIVLTGLTMFITYTFTDYGQVETTKDSRQVTVIIKSLGLHDSIAEFYEPYMGALLKKSTIPNQLLDGPDYETYDESRIRNSNYQ
ncbi:MAG: hypothetical protein RR437_09485 [Clostridium sp.]